MIVNQIFQRSLLFCHLKFSQLSKAMIFRTKMLLKSTTITKWTLKRPRSITSFLNTKKKTGEQIDLNVFINYKCYKKEKKIFRFKLRYHPDENHKRRNEHNAFILKRLEVFMDLMNKGWLENVSSEFDKSKEIIKFLDAGNLTLCFMPP